MRFITKLTTILALALMLAMAATANAADKVTYKDGRTIEGVIVEENDSFIKFLVKIGTIETERLIFKDDIKSIERDVKTPGKTPGNDATAPTNSDSKRDALSIPEGATKVAFLKLGDAEAGADMVGPYLNGKAIMESARILRALPKEERPDIVVLHIDSGGGAVAEIEDIIEAIHEDLKKDFRVVCWIEFAISGAAFTAMNVEELYFFPEGSMGGNVAYSGNKAMSGEGLMYILEVGERVSKNGRLNPYIMRSMQIFGTLSADIDENGNVTWHWQGADDPSPPIGEYVVSRRDEILTLNSLDALKFGISRGTAKTKDELAKLMGCDEWVEVGQRANDYQTEFRNNVKNAEVKLGEVFTKLQMVLQAPALDAEGVVRNVGRARKYLAQMRSLVRGAPSLEKYSFMAGVPQLTDEWFEEVDRELKNRIREANRD